MSIFGFKRKVKEQFIERVEESIPSVQAFDDASLKCGNKKKRVPLYAFLATCALTLTSVVVTFVLLSNARNVEQPLLVSCEDASTWSVSGRFEKSSKGYSACLAYGISAFSEGQPIEIEADNSDVEFTITRTITQNSVDGITRDQESISSLVLLKLEGAMDDFWNQKNLISFGDYSTETENPAVFPHGNWNVKYPNVFYDDLVDTDFVPTGGGHRSIGWLHYSVWMERKDGNPFYERGISGNVVTTRQMLSGAINCYYVYGKETVTIFGEKETAQNFYYSLD